MTFLTIKAAILAVALALGCAGGPDELELGYGRMFNGDSSLEGWSIDQDDTDIVTVGLVWKLRPTEVIVRSPYGDGISAPPPTTPSSGPTDPTPQPVVGGQDAEEASHEEIEDHIVQDLTDAVHTFNEIDWLTRVLLVIAVCWLGWVYRERLGRLIPGGKNGKK